MISNFIASASQFFHSGAEFFGIVSAPFVSSNEHIFIFHSVLVSLFAIVSVRLGRGALTAFMASCWILGNLFVIKEATIFGLDVVTADGFAIGANIAVTLIQTYYGEKAAKNAIWIGFFSAFFFMIMSQIHLLYIPNVHDYTHPHFVALLGRMTRIVGASFIVSMISSRLNLFLFKQFKTVFGEKSFGTSAFLSLTFSQIVDTALFAFVALYGDVHSIWQIILFSSMVKTISIGISVPCVNVSKYFIKNHPEL